MHLEKILFATDFSENSEHAFEYALSLARQFNAKLYLVHVINEPVDLRGFYVPHISFEKLEKEIEEGAEKMMQKFCQAKLKDFSNYESSIIAGIPYEEIMKKAEAENISLIVLGTQGRKGLDHFLFGSTAERVVRSAKCPVMTVRLP
ncbi:universal stress protein [Geomobilimonas luticola]|uniref:Universal stress protein n=1 Tax=Geomobilimonas luticola TaxID=1114878 RepID=A0ABS5SE37_9BACT|nr:universal stress protein [Geomobilimonas luticola]MBT0653608.1 universal stress protein [Geomobilimonas luticola]